MRYCLGKRSNDILSGRCNEILSERCNEILSERCNEIFLEREIQTQFDRCYLEKLVLSLQCLGLH